MGRHNPATGRKRIDEVFQSPAHRTPQQNYAQAFADLMASERVNPGDTWPQSFNVEDVLYWAANTRYGRQAVYLLDYNAADPVNDVIIQAPYNTMDRMEYFRMLR